MAKMDISKRPKAEKLIYDVFSILDPTGTNTKRYREIFSNMSDTEFIKLMTNMIEDDTLNFVLDVVDFERDVDLVKAKKAADLLGVPLEEYCIMPFVNGNKDNPTITKEKVFVGYIIEKRLQQTTQKKNGISINISDRSPTTGQVVNHDKNGRSSDQENMALFATGAINAATEFNGFRADGMQRKNQAYSSITQKGYCTLEELDAGIEDRTILNTIDVLYTGMSIKTDLVNNDYMLIDTMKKIKQKTAATRESVESDEDEEYHTLTEGLTMNNISTPNQISRFMKLNISYSHPSNWTLKSYDDVLSTKSGDCHDQSLFEYTWLKKLGYKCGRLFMIEYTGDVIYDAGSTHTACYYYDKSKIYWIENAWANQSGIHGPYDSIDALKHDIYDKWNFSGKYDRLYIGQLGRVSAGMDLEEYVLSSIPSNGKPSKYYSKKSKGVTEGILSKTPSILIDKKDVVLNIDKWGTAPEYNVLFITGFSGSGKSTLSKQYTSNDVHVFELDAYTANSQPMPKDEFYNYMITNVPDIDMLLEVKKTGKLLPTYKYSQILVNVIGAMLQFAEINYPKKKFIIEGIQLYRDVPTDYVYGRPLIIKGTSALHSLINRLNRDGYEYRTIFDYLNWYTLDAKRMDVMYKEITEGMLDDVVNGVNPYSNEGDEDEEYCTLTEAVKPIPKHKVPKDILAIHSKLNSYSYGVVKNGKITNNVSFTEWNKLYKLLTPDEVDKYRGGCCWDFVSYQYDRLTKLGYKVTNYFIITDTPPAYETHTISVVDTDKGPIYIESAFGDIVGVYSVTSLPDLFDYIVSHMWAHNKNELRFAKIKYDVRQFNDYTKYGSRCEEYMNFMITKTPIVYQGESINPSGRTEDQVYDPPYDSDQIKEKYGINMYNKLMKDDAHKFRALSGIELIHKEPSIDEFNRIWHNWNNMTDDMKAESDKESIRIFGVDNKTHYNQLLSEYGVTEGMFDDVLNGVNPYSNKLFFHVSTDPHLNGKTLTPRLPSWISDYIKKHGKKKLEEFMKNNGVYEDYTIPRVCFSNSINGALNALIPGSSVINAALDGGIEKLHYVYIPEKPINEYKYITNKDIVKNGYVYDADISHEMWVLEPVKLVLYGVIKIDQVRNTKPSKMKNAQTDIPMYNFNNDIKWSWKIHPNNLKWADREIN